jgi:dTDP-4-amino-4,6-dideoxygalactose transaminase
VFHYVPLHSAPQGLKVGRCAGPMTHTENLSERLLRLPMWVGVDAAAVIEALCQAVA